MSIHPFHNKKFAQNSMLPALSTGFDKRQCVQQDFKIHINVIVISGENEIEFITAKEMVKSLLGFYASTPAYKRVMDAIDMGNLQPRLNQLSKQEKKKDTHQI